MSRMAEVINRALITRKARVISCVYETDDYSMFKELENNRDVTKLRAEKLIASFSEKEILNPIIVNEKMEIVDGQGRVEALKSLGRSIKFIVVPGATIEDCRRLNQYNTKWTTMTFVTSFASSGNENYKRLLECREKTKLPFALILRLVNQGDKLEVVEGGKVKYRYNKINAGLLKFTDADKENAIHIYNIAVEIKNALQLSHRINEAFYVAVKVMIEFDGYDHARMLRKCKSYKHKFTQMANLENALKEFSSAYNQGQSSKNKLYFEDYMRNKGYKTRDYSTNTAYDFSESVKTLGGNNE